jgi:phosphate:Na+ symporter
VFGAREVATLAGGLALFLYGLYRARSGLERVAGGRLKAVLALVTRRPVAAAGAGFGLTLVTQSSSAVAVILIGMVSSGLMAFEPSVAILLGSDVATTLTVQIIAFDVSTASLAVISVGTLLVLTGGRRSVRKYAGDVVLGFGLIFFGMGLMKDAAGPLQTSEMFSSTLVQMGEWPILGILAGTIGTAVIQSSGAMVGLVLALAQAGALGDEPLLAAIPIVLGANVGTAATGIIAAVGATRDARRVAFAHIATKIVGVAIMYPLIGAFAEFTHSFTVWMGGGAARDVANAHMLFNVGKLLIFLPAAPLFVRFARRALPERPEGVAPVVRHLRDTRKDTPEVVLVKVSRELANMAARVRKLLASAVAAFEAGGVGEVEALRAADDDTDALHAAVVTNLRGIASEELSRRQAAEVERLLYLVRDLEQAGDIVCGRLAPEAGRKARSDAHFAIEGQLDFKRLGAEVESSLRAIEEALADEGALARLDEVVDRERGIDGRIREIESAHFRRAAAGVREAVETDSVFTNAVGELRHLHLLAFDIANVILEGSAGGGPGHSAGRRDAASGDAPPSAGLR